MNEKRCSKCRIYKDLSDYYKSCGKPRGECKKCTSKANVRYQKRVGYWRERYANDEERREYMRAYYAKNKAKFIKYRAEFKKRFPDYYKDYFRNKKDK